MQFHKDIESVDYAGYIKLQYIDDAYYGGKDLMDEADYPFAEQFSKEVCKRWNDYHTLKVTLSNALTQIQFMHDMHPSESAEAAIKAIEKVL